MIEPKIPDRNTIREEHSADVSLIFIYSCDASLYSPHIINDKITPLGTPVVSFSLNAWPFLWARLRRVAPASTSAWSPYVYPYNVPSPGSYRHCFIKRRALPIIDS